MSKKDPMPSEPKSVDAKSAQISGELLEPAWEPYRHSFAYLFERFPSFVQTFVHREAVEMLRQGMSPALISIRQPEDPPELAEDRREEIFYLPAEKALRAEVDRLRETKRLRWRIRRALPKLRHESDSQRLFEAAWLGPFLLRARIRHVHAHFGGMAARTAWWLRRLYGIGYSFTGHANDIFCDTDFPVSNEDLVRGARFVVTETDYARRWMENKYPFARGKMHRVFNGIATEGFPPLQAPQSRPLILSVGRYVEKKGFRHLIAACDLLRKEGWDFECLIVGGGPLEGELRERLDRAGLGQNVTLAGPRSQAEVRQLFARSQVFVLACVVEEGGGSDNLPTVIMEAMAAGVPVVSTPVAGVPEMIRDGEDGLLVPAGNPEALAAAISKILDDPALGALLGRAGRQTAEEKFKIERTTLELIRLLVERAGVRVPLETASRQPSLSALRRPGIVARVLGR